MHEAVRALPALASEPRILDRFAEDLARCGVVGETRAAKLIYLAVTSRVLPRPISVAVKGPSSGGKSFTTEQVLRFFPESAYYLFTAMSERVLAYTEKDLRHRFIVLFEAAGMGPMASYLIRSLLSEGRIVYEVVEKTDKGLSPRQIKKEGPTGLLVTTTALKLHPENETRLISVTVTDSQDQTRAVFRALASGQPAAEPDFTAWRELQEWVATAKHDVVIPYAHQLAELLPTSATRLRRDFGALLALIKTHAILHQESRERDEDGHIVAILEDYEVIRDIVADLLAEGVDAAVNATVRETVNAVATLQSEKIESASDVSLHEVKRYLDLDKSTTSRRVRAALEAGYLRNNESRRGMPLRLVLGDPIPSNSEVLPPVELLHCCAENRRVLPATADSPDDSVDAGVLVQ